MEDAYVGNAWIETQYGEFRLAEPKFDIMDIAHSLSLICRYNGHTNRFYSVAQHSLLVAHLMEELDLGSPLEGLLHDGTEAYLSDVPAPFKHELPDWQHIDKHLEAALRRWYGLPEKKTDGCKHADMLALFIEADALMRNRGANYEDPLGVRPYALGMATSPDIAEFLVTKPMARWKHEFMLEFYRWWP